MKNQSMDVMVSFRLNPIEYKKLGVMAGLYAGGQKSSWIRHCLTEYTPQMIKKGRKRKRKQTLSTPTIGG